MLITLPPEQKKDKGVEGIMTTQLPRHGRARIFVCLVAIAGSHGAAAASIINIWNGAASGDGSYLNSGNIANTLAFTNVNVSATQEIRYIETVNLANGSFGQTFFNLTNTAPKTTVSGDVTMGFGNFVVTSATIDLDGRLYAGYGVGTFDGSLLGATRLTGNATTVNVLSNTGNLQQAIFLTQTSPGLSTINAAFGSASSLSFNMDTQMFLSGGLLSGAVAMNHANSYLELHGYNFELDAGSGFTGIGSGPISAMSGQLRGYLNSGDSFNVSFTQGSAGRINVVSAVPVPGAAWLLTSALAGLSVLRRKNAKH